MAEEHTTTSGTKEEGASLHFIEQIIADDLQSGKHQRIHTRFPPEPNGYLHIGHAKAICLSFGLAEKYDGLVNLRFDDTNPEKENREYVDAIRRDVSWLGYEWNGGEFYTSDYFEQLYGFAVKLIELGKAYVDHQTAEEIRASRLELQAAYDDWLDRLNRSARTADWSHLGQSYMPDATVIETVLGRWAKREAIVRETSAFMHQADRYPWVFLNRFVPMDHVIDDERGWVWAKLWATRRYSSTPWPTWRRSPVKSLW